MIETIIQYLQNSNPAVEIVFWMMAAFVLIVAMMLGIVILFFAICLMILVGSFMFVVGASVYDTISRTCQSVFEKIKYKKEKNE